MKHLPTLAPLMSATIIGPALAQSVDSFEARGLSSRSDSDSDGDGLIDSTEIELALNPFFPDTDGDGLLDGWEVLGVNGLDLAALGANPRRKDIFIEMDVMERASATNGLGPNAAVLDTIVAVFASAPVDNPDGSAGITLHLELGNTVPHDDVLDPPGTEFLALKAVHFDPAKLPVYHYMIWADTYLTFDGLGRPTTGSSGTSFAIPNSDFIVTLGAWNETEGGSDAEKIGTFIHELGHNLGLKHGGSDHVGYKPNHISVMNYRWQTTGVIEDENNVFDYQRLQIGALDETQLIEGDGLATSSPALAKYLTAWSRQDGSVATAPAGDAIDWNTDGATDVAPLALNLNGDLKIETLTSTPNEWLNIIYNGGAIGQTLNLDGLALMQATRSREVMYPELTQEDALLTRVPTP